MLSIIKQRRSIRKYVDKQVEDSDLSLILEAGQYAPSGGNNQSSKIIVIQNKEVLQNLVKLVTQEFSKMEIREGMYPSIVSSIKQSKQGNYQFFYNAPTLVVIVNKKGYGNALADSACVLQNMMLAATSLQIGTCWINQLRWLNDNPSIRDFLIPFGMEDDDDICGGLSIGYSAEKQKPPLARNGNTIKIIT